MMSEEELNKYADIMHVLGDVNGERMRQNNKWSAQPEFNDDEWFPILMEEVGEVAMARLEHDSLEALYKELIQVAAVSVAWAQKVKKVIDELAIREVVA